MTPQALIAELEARGVRLTAEGARLHSDAPKGALTPELREAIKAHRVELIAALKRESSNDPHPDWNDLPEPGGPPFDAECLARLNSGDILPVWSEVLGEHVYFVRDDATRQMMIDQGCTVATYTLPEITRLQDTPPDAMRRIHEFKKAFGAVVTEKREELRP